MTIDLKRKYGFPKETSGRFWWRTLWKYWREKNLILKWVISTKVSPFYSLFSFFCQTWLSWVAIQFAEVYSWVDEFDENWASLAQHSGFVLKLAHNWATLSSMNWLPVGLLLVSAMQLRISAENIIQVSFSIC